MKKRTKKNKKRSILRRILLVLLVIIVIAGGVFSHFGGFGTGGCANTEEFAKYAGTVSDITIPEQTRVIALGEATHGNAEFQQLKLDVFKVMVEKYGVRAFALEGDYGGCEAANRYIHSGEGTAQEAAAAIGFAIYRTEQMEQLIEWMREYNESAREGEDLRFYGFDMQRIEYNYQYLLEAARKAGVDCTELEKLWDEEAEGFSSAYDSGQRAEIFEAVKSRLLQQNSTETALEVHFADTLLQNMELGKVTGDNAAGSVLRDRYMADNVLWILSQEEARGNQRIFISAHIGHVERFGSYGTDGKVTGNLLADELGPEYFVIGTDFYKTSCNLPGSSGKRSTHSFYSHDLLAKASAKCGYEISWLDFSKIPEESELKQQITDYTWMGSLGDYYSPVMAVMPMAYRVWRSPAELYDGMIFVTNAHPTMIR